MPDQLDAESKAESVKALQSRKYPQVRVSSYVSGTGMNVPERVVTNEHFASYLDTSDQWIRDRTGIAERRWADPGVSASELAEPAARQAIAAAGLTAEQIDGIIFATVTPDYLFPSTACFLQKRLGVSGALAFDLNAVCSGFIYSVVMADSLIAAGRCRNVLVVGADLYSRIINPNDRGTCVLFGDGAGAIVLSAVTADGGLPASNSNGQLSLAPSSVLGSAADLRGLYSAKLGADGMHTDILCVPRGTAAEISAGSLQSEQHFLRMEGREVFKLAVRRLSDLSKELLDEVGVSPDQVDHFISHQANRRILLAMAKSVGVPESKVPMNVEKYGNTSAASLPLLLAESVRNGVLKRGDLVLLSAFGGGVTWGAALLRW